MSESIAAREARSGPGVSRREFVRVAGTSAAGMVLAGLQPATAAPPAEAPGRTKVFIREVKQAVSLICP